MVNIYHLSDVQSLVLLQIAEIESLPARHLVITLPPPLPLQLSPVFTSILITWHFSGYKRISQDSQEQSALDVYFALDVFFLTDCRAQPPAPDWPPRCPSRIPAVCGGEW